MDIRIMARKPRIEFAGAVYHVISRGDRGEAIYKDDEDRLLFLRFLGVDLGKKVRLGNGRCDWRKFPKFMDCPLFLGRANCN